MDDTTPKSEKVTIKDFAQSSAALVWFGFAFGIGLKLGYNLVATLDGDQPLPWSKPKPLVLHSFED